MTEMLFKNFFQARDELDAALDAGELTLTGPQNAVLRYLVEHSVFDKQADDLGWVVKNATAVEVIARRTGYSPRTVKNVLAELEDLTLISRYHQPKWAGGRSPDTIRVDGLFDAKDDAPEYVEPKAQEMHLREGAGDAPYEGARDAPSSNIEEPFEQPVADGKDQDQNQGTGYGDTPPADFQAYKRAWFEFDGIRRFEEEHRTLDEYAERFHGGKRAAARYYVNGQTDGRPGSSYAYMREVLGRAA